MFFGFSIGMIPPSRVFVSAIAGLGGRVCNADGRQNHGVARSLVRWRRAASDVWLNALWCPSLGRKQPRGAVSWPRGGISVLTRKRCHWAPLGVGSVGRK